MAIWLLLSIALCFAQPPAYQTSGVVNAATGQPDLAPNTLVSIFGKDLARGTRSLTVEEARGTLPTVLPGTGTSVYINGQPVPVWMASPEQVNIVIPSQVRPSNRAKFVLVVNGLRGDELTLRIVKEAPGLFPRDPETVSATHADGSPVKAEAPARPGEDVVLLATGLGPVSPEIRYFEVARGVSPLVRRADFRVLLNDVVVEDSRIGYVGAAPGYSGTYQINLSLPDDTPADPEVRIALGDLTSPAGLKLPVR
jgi:uncharacterized protein (TIGR03437 family)